MRAAAGILAAATLVVGCGLLAGPVPEWVANRQPLESCGEEDLDRDEPYDEIARRCLFDAYQAGRGAELITSALSIEGDPIVRYIRVHENGVVEIFHDATRDRFGSGEWERLVCSELDPVAEVNDPPEVVFPADMVFIEDGCEQLPIP